MQILNVRFNEQLNFRKQCESIEMGIEHARAKQYEGSEDRCVMNGQLC